MDRSRMYDSLLLTILLIGVSTFPVNLLVNDIFWYYVIEALLMLAVFIFILFYESRHPEIVPFKRRFSLTYFLWLLPVILIPFSNFLYALIFGESLYPNFALYNIPQVAFIALNIVVEEYIFRRHLLGNLNHPKKIIRILISAGIFGLCHITRFLSTFNPLDLIVVVYAFGLGMVLGLIYCYTNSFISCIVLHFLFNLVNDFLFTSLFGVSEIMWYYLINAIFALIIGLYLLFVYLFVLEKKPSNSRLN